jgi:hypothetical protein
LPSLLHDSTLQGKANKHEDILLLSARSIQEVGKRVSNFFFWNLIDFIEKLSAQCLSLTQIQESL